MTNPVQPPIVDAEKLEAELRKEPTESSTLYEEGQLRDEAVDRRLRLEKVKMWQEYNVTLGQNNQARKDYAKKIFIMTSVWGALIFVIIFLHAFKIAFLSDQVLITLITSTTINFFGFFLLVIKYLFHTGPHYLPGETEVITGKPGS